MAEYYHIYDYEELSPKKVATFLFGLREESRTTMARTGQKVKMELILLATIADELNGMLHPMSEDRVSLLALLLDCAPKEEKKCMSFNTSDSFIDWWNKK